jgi:CBS domain-containing protein
MEGRIHSGQGRRRWWHDRRTPRRVGEVMQRDVITIPPRTPLREVLRLLHEHGISGAPVVDDFRYRPGRGLGA